MTATRARTADGWTTFCGQEAQDVWTVRALLSGSFGCSLSHMLPELAIMCLFRYLVIFVTIVMPCDAALVPVLPAAPRRALE